MSAKGYKNPTDRSCWETCQACGRCAAAKTCSLSRAGLCSGRWDPEGRIDPYPSDYCKCTEGILQWRTQKGEMIIAKYNHNPFKGTVRGEAETEDERDWNSYVSDMREKMDDPNYSPVEIYDE